MRKKTRYPASSAALPAILAACSGSTVGSPSEKGEFDVEDEHSKR